MKASYGVNIVSIWEDIDRVMTIFYSMMIFIVGGISHVENIKT